MGCDRKQRCWERVRVTIYELTLPFDECITTVHRVVCQMTGFIRRVTGSGFERAVNIQEVITGGGREREVSKQVG